MVRLGEPVLDAMLAADTVEHACGSPRFDAARFALRPRTIEDST
jgi:hypothetical protein